MKPLAFALLLTVPACAPDAQGPPAPTPPARSVADTPPRWFAPPAAAERWAPSLHSPDGWTFTPTFSADLRTAYFARWDAPDYYDPDSIQELLVTTWDEAGGVWSEPQRVAATAGWRVDWPHLSPDGRRFLISTNRPHPGHYDGPGGPIDDFDLWGADRRPDGSVDWSTFAPLAGDDLNRQKTPENARIRYVHNETSPRLTRDGVLYFWTERLDDGGGWRDVYTARPDGRGGYLAPTLLPFNTARRESGVAVDPDGRWLVVASEGTGGAGRSDLFVVPRDGDGWATPVNLGPAVNTEHGETSPELSPDGRALFFTSDRPGEGVPIVDAGEGAAPASTVYWVDLAAVPAFRAAVGR